MKSNRISTLVIILGMCLSFVRSADAQDTEGAAFTEDSRMWIDGTSNRDDWTVQASEINGFVRFSEVDEQIRIDDAELIVPARSLEGGRSSIMDRLMYGALKADAHPEIRYVLGDVEVTNGDGGTFELTTTGQLTLAGVTNDIQVPVTAERLENGDVRFTGEHQLTMTEYDMDPPTAMFGALRTGDEVVVNFELVVSP